LGLNYATFDLRLRNRFKLAETSDLSLLTNC